ncbi:MAG: DNA topology modulation protein [Pleurocapsa sp. MO_192.B19]|nr:DNA topology modulation protein [Pleurocapsa sp. MO_192.B19]
MQRVAIIGSCGAGKSTLSKTLGEKLKLPIIHLDAYYWKSGWQESDGEEWQQIHQDLIKGDRWIIDGNYGNTMNLRLAAADTIIWLDFNRYLCLWRVFKRYMQYGGKTRPDMAHGCPERLNWEFLNYVWNFPRLHRHKISTKLAQLQNNQQIIILQNSSQVSDLLKQIK